MKHQKICSLTSESVHGWGLLRVTAQVATHLCSKSMQTKGRGWWEDWVFEHSFCRKGSLFRFFSEAVLSAGAWSGSSLDKLLSNATRLPVVTSSIVQYLPCWVEVFFWT